MRVLFIEPCPRGFGGFHRARHTAQALVELGHTVRVVFFGSRERRKGSRESPMPGLEFIELPTFGPPWLAKLLRIPLVVRHALFSRVDIVHIFTSVHPENLAAIFLCRLFRRRFIVDWDDYWQDSGFARSKWRLLRWYVRFSEEVGPRLATAVTVASDFLYEQAERLGCKRIHKLPNGCPRDFFELVPRDEARRRLSIAPDTLVLFAFGNGFLNGRGRLLVQFAQAVAAGEPNLVFIVNMDPRRDLWMAELNDGAPPPPDEVFAHFRNVGRVPEKELGLYLGAADFAAFLVHDIPAEKSCSPIRLAAYMSGECPIATTDVKTEARRLVLDYRCGVIGRTVPELAALVLAAHRDRAPHDRMRAGARQAHEALSFPRVGAGLVDLYVAVSARRGACWAPRARR
jgi:hypothetical protein